MNPMDYLESVKECLSTDSIVLSFDVIREFANLNDGVTLSAEELSALKELLNTMS